MKKQGKDCPHKGVKRPCSLNVMRNECDPRRKKQARTYDIRERPTGNANSPDPSPSFRQNVQNPRHQLSQEEEQDSPRTHSQASKDTT